jgi:hypothetical protein
MDWSRTRWVLNSQVQGIENCEHTLAWIKMVDGEIESAISTFHLFPQTYDAVEVDKTNTFLTDFTRRIKKNIWDLHCGSYYFVGLWLRPSPVMRLLLF